MTEPALVIEIDIDKKCIRCGKKGAMENGYCLKCATNLIIEKMRKGKP